MNYLAIFIIVIFILLAIFYFWASSSTRPGKSKAEILDFSITAKSNGECPGHLTLINYNISYLSGMSNNTETFESKDYFTKNRANFTSFVNKEKPDFIAFQEIDFNSHRSYYTDQLALIARQCGFRFGATAINWDKRYVPFPYWPPRIHFKKVLSGQAILSRYPVKTNTRTVLVKVDGNPFYYNAFYLDRLVQIVKVAVAEKTVVILNVHLEAFAKNTRIKQAVKTLEIYRSFAREYPVLLVGDFNCVPPNADKKKGFSNELETDYSSEPTIKIFLEEESLSEATIISDSGVGHFTFPSSAPDRKLDYIFFNHDKIEIISARVVKISSSDHLPLVMKFKIR